MVGGDFSGKLDALFYGEDTDLWGALPSDGVKTAGLWDDVETIWFLFVGENSFAGEKRINLGGICGGLFDVTGVFDKRRNRERRVEIE